MKFSGKVAIITGSSSGIGQATALLLAQEGASVVIHGRSKEKIEATEKLLCDNKVPSNRVLSIRGEIQDEQCQKELLNKTIAKFGKLDVLVNNAGLGGDPKLRMESMEQFDYIHDVNVKSIIALNNLALPYLENTKGNIVSVSSLASVHPADAMVYYAMSKAALDHYTRSRAENLAQKGIRINCVNPGYIKTQFLTQLNFPEDFQEKYSKTYDKQIPLGRSGVPMDIAKAISFLASDDAGYITGVCLVVDGGILVKSNLVTR
ncbi:hypothetical protein L596_016024 [Steinernema carpocapsae]|uniref:Uncharacterized protein n=1 Tax=Steinernema carpocapsae TaxID=34508 RepID=A0A4U5NGV7_STECR|nr:hypothetical protein L596_016024 [Steinernema carpocapsae]